MLCTFMHVVCVFMCELALSGILGTCVSVSCTHVCISYMGVCCLGVSQWGMGFCRCKCMFFTLHMHAFCCIISCAGVGV